MAETGCRLALRNVSLTVGDGELFIVMGMSGSGKSTLVRHINRLIEPSSGAILFDGQDIIRLGRHDLRLFRRRTVSMVFQGFGLMPHRTVLHNVALGLLARREAKAIAYAKAREWLDIVGLQGHQDAYPEQLSGGMKQRVGLARALAVDTDVVLMDEAFSALDPLIRADMQDLLLDLQAKLQKTVVFITHDFSEAVRLGDRVALMNNGVVVQTGTPAEILATPADDYVARFVQIAQR